MPKRVIILVLDSLGIGATADAHKYSDVPGVTDAEANTLGHIIKQCAQGLCDNNQRQGALCIPNLARWGLVHALHDSVQHIQGQVDDDYKQGLSQPIDGVKGAYGFAKELSLGKDTPSGHWEICGLPVMQAWGMFAKGADCFPADLLSRLCKNAGLGGTLANCHASGTEIIKQYGQQHMQTGWPICYTSADSVFQIAAHEHTFGLDRLYELCDKARPLMDELNVGRVIARPFVGDSPDTFKRSSHRRDLTTPPGKPTLLDYIRQAHLPVTALGKIGDIFAHQGIDTVLKADGNQALMDALMQQLQVQDDGLLFVNLVDFDTLYGHRRDVTGYAQALETLDERLPQLEQQLKPDDLVLVTADHGCDPTMPGSDHTREHVPVVFVGPKVKSQALGLRDTFADMGQTMAHYLNTQPLPVGTVCPLN